MIFWTIATWIVTPICIYFFHATGVAIAAALIGSTSYITIIMIKKVIHFHFLDQVWRQLLSSVVMYIALMQMQSFLSESFLQFVLGVLVGGLIYAALMVAIGFKKLQFEIKSLK
jgi:hypothetical protein